MDKYTKTRLLMIKIPIGIFCILVGLSLIGVSFWVSTFSDVASLILLISTLGGGCLINFGIGYAFIGDEYKTTNIVHNGNTTFIPIETTPLLKRRKVVTFIGFISYVLLSAYYIIRVIYTGINMNKLIDNDYNVSIGALIIFAVISLIIAFFLFLLYKRTKHIDLNEW